jgi:broad-specificity NMP kinase
MNKNTIVIVSGLPRSGTSMMMKMLEAGGLDVLTDHIRTPDEDNPKGYYEFERVKKVEEDKAWLPEAQGKVVKMISALLKHLPSGYQFKIIFMRRDMAEILASQRRMLVRRGEQPDRVEDERMSELFEHHLQDTFSWLADQPHMEVLKVSYNEVLAGPVEPVARINEFLGGDLDEERMVDVVDPALYRQRQ